MLIPPEPAERSGASVQRRYIESGKFDFCIDEGERVTLLTSDSSVWKNIEAGTRIVMRVVFERRSFFSATYYECHLCGAWNKLVSFDSPSEWVTDGSLDWCVLCTHRENSISHGEVMRAKEDFRSRMIEIGRRKVRTTILTRKLGTLYATSVSRKLFVSVTSSIVIR